MQRLKFWTRLRELLLLSIGIAAVVVAARYFTSAPSQKPISLTLTTGRLDSERTRAARALAAECRARGITLNLVETKGSEDAILRLAAPGSKLDLALVQGGLAVEAEHHQRLRQVLALHDEALHFLVRGDALALSVQDEGFGALRGRSIAISVPGSGTHRLAREVLSFAGLEPNDYRSVELDGHDVLNLSDDQLPDAVFVVAMLPSRVAAVLVGERNYKLVPLPYADAFALWRPVHAGDSGILHRFVRAIVIPALAYDREPPVPDGPLETLATRTLLLARTDLPTEVVERLLAAVFETPFARYDDPPLEAGRLSETPELTWHAGSVLYRDRSRPIIADDLLDMIEKEVSILAALTGALFFAWQWLQKKIHRIRDEGFSVYIRKVAEIERVALEIEAATNMELPRLLRLQRQLSRLKSEALEKFVGGDQGDSELITGFLAQVNDARQNLTRLILHQRENLEELAKSEGRPVEMLWREALEASTAEQTPTSSGAAAGTDARSSPDTA